MPTKRQTAPRSRTRAPIVPPSEVTGLIVTAKKSKQSVRTESALDNHSHRTAQDHNRACRLGIDYGWESQRLCKSRIRQFPRSSAKSLFDKRANRTTESCPVRCPPGNPRQSEDTTPD